MKFSYVGLSVCIALSIACHDAVPVKDTCDPRTCDESSATCGSKDDGCGGVRDCGPCPGQQCTPKTCSDLTGSCGAVGDGCGGTIDCGPCQQCTPKTCGELSASCGEVADGCGGILQCGTCAEGSVCKNGGAVASCEQTAEKCEPKTCAELAATCGQLPDGCGRVLECGSCAPGSSCSEIGGGRSCGAVATVPGKPTAVVAVAGLGAASLSWQAPASDGGSALTGYIITILPDGRSTPAGLNRSSTISQLVPGKSYTFTVRAVNAAGEGPQSDPSNAVVPTAAACARELKLLATYTTHSYSRGVTVTDYDRDGAQDVVIGSASSGSLSLFRNTGGGNLVNSIQLPSPNAHAVVAADFNRDGAPDLASVGSPLVIHTNTGSGTFTQTDSLASSLLDHLLAADVDGDGDADLLGGGPSGMWGGAVLWTNAQGRFTQGRLFASGRDAISTSVGDFNGDGRADVLVAGAMSEKSVFMYRGEGGGAFADDGLVSTGGTNVDIARGQWNADGPADFVVATTNRLSMFLGRAGTAGPVAGPTFTESAAGGEIQDLTTMDVDKDGVAEVVAVYRWFGSQPRGEVVTFRATSNSLTVIQRLAVATMPSAAASGDLDGDGFDDLVVSHADDNRLYLFVNRCRGQ